LGSELPDEFADQLKARGTLKTGDDMLVCQSQTPGGRGDATTPGPGPSPTLPEPFSESSTKPLAATTVHPTTATRARSSVESKYTCGSLRLHDRAGIRHTRRWMSSGVSNAAGWGLLFVRRGYISAPLAREVGRLAREVGSLQEMLIGRKGGCPL
jgi:hypothetical protein